MLCNIRMAWGRQEWWRQFPHHGNACLEYWFDPDIPSAARRLRTVVYIVVASAGDSRRGAGMVRGGSSPLYTDCIVKFLYIIKSMKLLQAYI